MRRLGIWVCMATLAATGLTAAETPYNEARPLPPGNLVDRAIEQDWRQAGITPSPLCSDAVFCRRVWLDITGTLPTAKEAAQFLADTSPDKRRRLVDQLLDSEAYVNYWTMKWADTLRVKSEYPINLWPNAVQSYHRWLRNAIQSNMPYDVFARTLLTASGSNFRSPPANFYRAVQEHTPAGRAAAVALTFMGSRIDKWPVADSEEFQKFFTSLAFKRTAEWKEEIVYHDPAPREEFKIRLPDGQNVTVPPQGDPRQLLAVWLTSPENPWFARAAVNRLWFWVFGRGIIHEPDDCREGNPPACPVLLKALEQEFVRSGYDQKALLRLIFNSACYQQSAVRTDNYTAAENVFAVYPVRRLEAEVIVDAIARLTGVPEEYSSVIPEPFTYLPAEQGAVAMADGSISSTFLEIFGRAARDNGYLTERNNQSSCPQRLYLMNSNQLQRRFNNSPAVRDLMNSTKNDRDAVFRGVYLLVLSRYPTAEELKTLAAHYPGGKKPTVDRGVALDLVWVLVNSKEFLYRH